ncbi:MAG: M23 family metallopeptidase, partial [Kiritimatiellales bacterium]
MKRITAALILAFTLVSSGKEFRTDFLTPEYYNGHLKKEADHFLSCVHKEQFRHPLTDAAGKVPDYAIPNMGKFGAEKGRGRPMQYHPAVDFHVGARETLVNIYAAHDGTVAAVRNAPKYRQYLSVTKEIRDDDGKVVGKLVTIYAHLDLDLDEADGLIMDGKTVHKGDLLSEHLYSGTMGGPHLHFEIRYYRPADKGTEEFYGFAFPGRPSELSEPSAGGWQYGFWNP